MCSRLSCVAGEMERLSLDLTEAAKNKGIWDCLEFVHGLRVMLAKSRSVRGAYHQPASMSSCLTLLVKSSSPVYLAVDEFNFK